MISVTDALLFRTEQGRVVHTADIDDADKVVNESGNLEKIERIEKIEKSRYEQRGIMVYSLFFDDEEVQFVANGLMVRFK